ncbi:MAG: sugar phosphate isomerase/epimerase, partial [Phycisphaerae bacterium]
MRLGYNTNGFAHHRIEDTFAILEDLGYQSVAVTLDHPILTSPDRKGISTARQVLSTLGARHGLRMTLETGARFLLDP